MWYYQVRCLSLTRTWNFIIVYCLQKPAWNRITTSFCPIHISGVHCMNNPKITDMTWPNGPFDRWKHSSVRYCRIEVLLISLSSTDWVLSLYLSYHFNTCGEASVYFRTRVSVLDLGFVPETRKRAQVQGIRAGVKRLEATTFRWGFYTAVATHSMLDALAGREINSYTIVKSSYLDFAELVKFATVCYYCHRTEVFDANMNAEPTAISYLEVFIKSPLVDTVKTV